MIRSASDFAVGALPEDLITFEDDTFVDNLRGGVQRLNTNFLNMVQTRTAAFQGVLDLSFSCVLLSNSESIGDLPDFLLTVFRKPGAGDENYEKGMWEEIGRTEITEALQNSEENTLSIDFLSMIPVYEHQNGKREYHIVLHLVEDYDNENNNKTIGEVSCTSEDLIIWKGNKLTLTIKPHSNETLGAQGVIVIQSMEPMKYLTPSYTGFLTQCPLTGVRFQKTSKDYRYLGTNGKIIKIKEILHECSLVFVICMKYLEVLINEEKAITREYDGYAFNDPQVENVRKQQAGFHLDLLNKYQSFLSFLGSY